MSSRQEQLSILIGIDPGMKATDEQYFVHQHRCTLLGRGEGRYALYFPQGTRKQQVQPHSSRYLLPDGDVISVETAEGQQESLVTVPLFPLSGRRQVEDDRSEGNGRAWGTGRRRPST